MEQKTIKFNLSQITAELMGAPYKLGGMDRMGFDCFSLVYKYLGMRGCAMPADYKGLTLETYPELFKTEPDKAKAIMMDFIAEYMDEIPKHKMFAGDVALVRVREMEGVPSFLVIDGGNGNIIGASEQFGVTITSTKYYVIEKVFRCLSQYR